VVEFVDGGLFERDDIAALGVDAGEDMFDGPVLACCIQALQNHQDCAGVGGVEQFLADLEFRCELDEVPLREVPLRRLTAGVQPTRLGLTGAAALEVCVFAGCHHQIADDLLVQFHTIPSLSISAAGPTRIGGQFGCDRFAA
jgi:hypothetical protein